MNTLHSLKNSDITYGSWIIFQKCSLSLFHLQEWRVLPFEFGFVLVLANGMLTDMN